MNTEELAAATHEFDGAVRGRPLTAHDLALHEQAGLRVGRGRPQVGEGAEKIRVSMERGLLRRADAYAKRNGLSRSQLIASAIEQKIAG